MKIIFVVPAGTLKKFAAERIPDAELYLVIGRVVRDCLRRGLSLSLIAQDAQTSVEECLLALKFVESSTGFKLEALVEDWSWSRISAEMAATELKESHWKLASF